MTSSFSSVTRILPNGTLVPITFNPLKIDDYVVEEQRCLTLKEELIVELNRLNLTELEDFFKNRGNEFLTPMFYVDPWKKINNKNKSILEDALEAISFNISSEKLLFLFKYLLENSEQIKKTKMNVLHLLVQNACSSLVRNLLINTMTQQPELLKARMQLNDDELDMTPVELAIRISYNSDLMNLMLTKYIDHEGPLTTNDKNKLLSHAKWLSESGVYTTSLIGEKLFERINRLPEIIQYT